MTKPGLNDVSGDPRYLDKILPDGRKLTLQPLTFGAGQLGISMQPPLHDSGMFADAWDFLKVEDAYVAFLVWIPDEKPEPDGWHRHPSSGRYRIDGRVDLEYVKCEDARDIKDNCIRAIMATCGKDRIIRTVREATEHLGKSYPVGTRAFWVFSESSECTHEAACFWGDQVFCRGDRYAVVKQSQFHRITIAEIIQRLTGENHE